MLPLIPVVVVDGTIKLLRDRPVYEASLVNRVLVSSSVRERMVGLWLVSSLLVDGGLQ